MSNEEQVERLKRGVKEWNAWRRENADVEIDLSEADLSEADLIEADLYKANLSGANLSRANLWETSLFCADLSRADLSGADLSGAILTNANLSGADLSEANLRVTSLVQTNLTNATLTGCLIYGISAWNVESEGAEQSNLVITQDGEPTVMVDNLDVAQFVYMLLNRGKLRDVLNEMTNKGVLILGQFEHDGIKVLKKIADTLREKGYLPLLFDFPKSESLTFTQTVKIMVGLSRFVIADLSGPSVLKELEASVPFYDVPIIPIIQEGQDPPSMIVDLKIYPWFRWPPVKFANRDELIDSLQENVIDPAEEIAKSRNEWRAMRVSPEDLQGKNPTEAGG